MSGLTDRHSPPSKDFVMRSLFAMASMMMMVFFGSLSASSTEFVNTNGQPIEKSSFGEICRVTEKLFDGRVMIYSSSESDSKILAKRMEDNGVTDPVEISKWIQMAQSNSCSDRAGLNCSGGTCSSGLCQSETNSSGYTGCKCK